MQAFEFNAHLGNIFFNLLDFSGSGSVLVPVAHYTGFWIQTPGKHTVLCASNNHTILNCETESCTTNCHDVYYVESDRIIYKRHADTTENVGLFDGIHIRWENNITWRKKGKQDD